MLPVRQFVSRCLRCLQCLRQRKRRSQFLVLLIATAIALIVGPLTLTLNHHRQQPVDAIFVLGGSVRREMYLVETLPRGESVPVLISNGSSSPCARALYEREGRSPVGVYAEHCARSTFDNFTYGIPYFRQWHSHHVQILSSGDHVTRATWMGRLLLGAHGIWVDIIDVPEVGVPGNTEAWWKTSLDLVRSLVWVPLSFFVEPRCDRVDVLSRINLDRACLLGSLHCEHQAQLKPYCKTRQSAGSKTAIAPSIQW